MHMINTQACIFCVFYLRYVYTFRFFVFLFSFVKESLTSPDGLHKALVEFLTTVLLTVASSPDKDPTALGLQTGVGISTDAQPLSSGRSLSTTTAVLSTRHTSGPSCTPVVQLHSTAPHTPAVLPGSIAQSDTLDLCTPVPPSRAGRQPNPAVPYTTIATQNTAAQTPTPYTSSTDVPMDSDHVASEQFKKCFRCVIEILVVSEQLLADILESFNSLLLGLCTQFCGVCMCPCVAIVIIMISQYLDRMPFQSLSGLPGALCMITYVYGNSIHTNKSNKQANKQIVCSINLLAIVDVHLLCCFPGLVVVGRMHHIATSAGGRPSSVPWPSFSIAHSPRYATDTRPPLHPSVLESNRGGGGGD